MSYHYNEGQKLNYVTHRLIQANYNLIIIKLNFEINVMSHTRRNNYESKLISYNFV